jgi:glycosyltransferase involved in cell wall biosynthesis
MAAHELRGEENIHFLFVGDGSEKASLMRLAEQSQLENVTFLDPVPAVEMPRYLSIAHCGLVPQRDLDLFKSNRPAKMFSIMGMGKPVLFCGRGEAAVLLEQKNAGLVVPPENPLALAEAVRFIVANPTVADAMGMRGRVFVEKELAWPIIVREWLRQLCDKTFIAPSSVALLST